MTTTMTCMQPVSLMDASISRHTKQWNVGVGSLDRFQINRRAQLIADAMGKGIMVLDDKRFVEFIRRTYVQHGPDVLEEIFSTANLLIDGKLMFFPCRSNETNSAALGELIYELEDLEFATKIFQPL